MNKILTGMFFIALFFSAAAAQEAKSEDMKDYFQAGLQKTEMRKLDSLAGKWSGGGWILRGAVREEFTGTENVQWKLGGLALLVEGRFTDIKDPSRVIHETLAVLKYNPKASLYDFKTYLAAGSSGDFIFKITADGYEWGMDYTGGKILYVISIKDGVWNEIGKMSGDGGKTWVQFFEMNLKKMS